MGSNIGIVLVVNEFENANFSYVPNDAEICLFGAGCLLLGSQDC